MGQYSNLWIRAFYRFSRGPILVLFGVTAYPLAGTAQVQSPNSNVVPSSNPSPIKPTEISSLANSPDFSKEALVFDEFHTRIHMDADGTGTRATTARIHVLADAGVKATAVIRFTYSASYQQVDIAYVRVRKPDGSVVETPSYNVQDMPADVGREAPMYSDIREKHVAVRLESRTKTAFSKKVRTSWSTTNQYCI